MKFLFLSALLLAAPQLFAKAPPVPTALATYIAAPDTSTKWELVRKVTIDESDVWQLTLTSQTWQGIPWTHDLLVIRPKAAPRTDQMLLINSGGSFNPMKPEGLMLGATLAQSINSPVAVLLGIPRQPLFGGKREDDLIAETFIKYLETGDESWPLLFPMVKSLVKAMDALQEFTGKEWEQRTEKFIVNGASKRGWTAWLTAAADPRVSAIAPMVIDMLNLTAQLPHQEESFGKISDQIRPYTKRGLIPIKDTAREKKLWAMVDPFTYREKYTMPKLIVLGNNDPYWTTDALNLYWDEIPGPKYISYTPNAGHNLTETSEDGKRNPMRAINNVSAFVRLQLQGKLPPEISWKHSDTPEGELQLDVTAATQPEKARLWYATAPTKDFRKARWQSKDLELPGRQNPPHPSPPRGGLLRLLHRSRLPRRRSHHVALHPAPHRRGKVIWRSVLPAASEG